MKDLRLTEDGDLYVTEDGDVQFTDSVLQAIKIRLKWFLGEWRINTTYGMPYYDEVFIKNPSTALIEDRVRTEILSVDGVQAVEILATVDNRIVAVRYANQIGIAFHPELDEDESIHKMFLSICL